MVTNNNNGSSVLETLEVEALENCKTPTTDPMRLPSSYAEVAPRLVESLSPCFSLAPAVAAFDLESVLVPEIWQTVAETTGVHQLALTTRDIADYGVLMRERIRLCRENGLTLARLREIVSHMQPLPGAVDFLAWVQDRMLAVIVSDTYHELAGPVVEKLGCPLMVCNALTVDEQDYVSGHRAHHVLGKAGAVAHFQRLGFQVVAVGDSYNDLAMLQAANVGLLFRPCAGLMERAAETPAVWNLEELRVELQAYLARNQSVPMARS